VPAQGWAGPWLSCSCAKARESWKGSGDTASESVWFQLREKLGATEFLGYETESAEGVVSALVRDGKEVDALKKDDSGAVVLNQTPFYGESGGQVGDTGLMTGEGVRFRVTDTQKKAGDLFVHLGIVEQGTLKVGTALQLDVDHSRRASIRAHHSATHVLHEALRQVLGDHIAQRGSLVAPDRLRFDFSHTQALSPDELRRVEDLVNSAAALLFEFLKGLSGKVHCRLVIGVVDHQAERSPAAERSHSPLLRMSLWAQQVQARQYRVRVE